MWDLYFHPRIQALVKEHASPCRDAFDCVFNINAVYTKNYTNRISNLLPPNRSDVPLSPKERLRLGEASKNKGAVVQRGSQAVAEQWDVVKDEAIRLTQTVGYE